MNEQRRAVLRKLAEQLSVVKSELDTVRDDEQTAFDNLPESLQEAEKGQAMEAAVEILDDAIDELEVVMNALDQAQE